MRTFPFKADPTVLLSATAQIWRDWRAKRRPIVLRPYIDLNTRWRLAARVLTPVALGVGCLVYGFYFALTAPFLIVPFAIPLLILVLLSIWALPEARNAPVRAMEVCLTGLIVTFALWPNYLAISLPGLPWITMVRLTAFPMAFLLLLSLSISEDFRRKIGEAASGAPLMVGFFVIFSINSALGLPFSKGIGDSLNKLVLQEVTWGGSFLVSLYLFRTPGRVQRYTTLLLMLAIPLGALALLEYHETHVLWASHVPSFLRVADESAQRALASSARGATGQYRSKATFSTALGLAEYMSLMTPFAIHWIVSRGSALRRLVGVLLLPLIFIVVRSTDSRLGVLGYIVSVASYFFFWSVVRFRRRVNDLMAATIIYAYPAMFVAVIAASMVFHKVHVLLFGGGAQVASNEHRQEQFQMAIPQFLKNPLGYGPGQSGEHMGYGLGDFIAIDSYYIVLSLEYGALGLFLYIGMFAIVIAAAVKTLMSTPRLHDKDVAMLMPLAAFLCAFVMVRSVFSQSEIHPLVFTILGMSVCLIARARNKLPLNSQAVVPGKSSLQVSGGNKLGLNFGSQVLVALAGAVIAYLACLAWWLMHH